MRRKDPPEVVMKQAPGIRAFKFASIELELEAEAEKNK